MPNYVVVEMINERIQPNALMGTYDETQAYLKARGATGVNLHANGYGVAYVNPTVKLLVFQTQPIDNRT